VIAAPAAPVVRMSVGPTRLISADFGYTVAYRSVSRGVHVRTAIGLFLYENGTRRKITPPRLDANQIDDVAFVDREHGWVAAYNCGEARVHLYRTNDGGRSWQRLGRPATHSCGGGPTWLSFPDTEHGWMEPVSPNAPGGELLTTSDAGDTWSSLSSFSGPGSSLPCLSPVEFVSASTGWMARCRNRLFTTNDAGRSWANIRMEVPGPSGDRLHDLPRFFGSEGVEATTIGAGAVAFSTSDDGGLMWSERAVRPVPSCSPQTGLPFPSSWPAGVASPSVWWIVARGRVQRTSDAGRHWVSVAAHGLPTQPCVNEVSVADTRTAWVVVPYGGHDDGALFQTHDGGRSWSRVALLG
jgi:photosystem II stability/assembly factor-like uncharacterized protein